MPNAKLARRVHAHLHDNLAATEEDLALVTLRVARDLNGQADDAHPMAMPRNAGHALSLDALDTAQLFSPGLTRTAALDALGQLASGAPAIDWDTILDPYGVDSTTGATT
ncbi:hypothetical protein ABZ023_18650 [Streptomyces sp. NPDC006367]|uniref:hypothetical protein n=1 Tax=unclassified Streptomyces TaxID=2593676 RepID=UPI0033AB5FB6